MITVGAASIDEGRIREFRQKWGIAELALFGSVLRDDFSPDSDIDVLVTFEPGETWRLGDLARMRDELAAVFGRHVDLVERRAVEQNPNWLIRRTILQSAQRLNVA
jgi:uncharacterized protein